MKRNHLKVSKSFLRRRKRIKLLRIKVNSQFNQPIFKLEKESDKKDEEKKAKEDEHLSEEEEGHDDKKKEGEKDSKTKDERAQW